MSPCSKGCLTWKVSEQYHLNIYILKRWSKHPKRWTAPHDYYSSSCNNAKASPLFDRVRLMQKVFHVIERSLMVNRGTEIIDSCFDQTLSKLKGYLKVHKMKSMNNLSLEVLLVIP